MCFQIAVKDWRKKRVAITRSKLAYEVAKRVKLFLDASAVSQCAPFVTSVLKNRTTDTAHRSVYRSTVDDWARLHEVRKDVLSQVHMGG